MSEKIKTKHADTIHCGMPDLKDNDQKITSFFEFWPSQIIYIPVVIQWLWLSLRYRSLSLPLIANPTIHLAGMVGESKSAVLDLAGKLAQSYIAPYIIIHNHHTSDIKHRTDEAIKQLEHSNIKFPIIAKPDMGCRGAGVKIIREKHALASYLQHFPDNSKLLLQHKVPYEAEAGIFYIRKPGEKNGNIFSITLKYAPYVIGNGKNNLSELIKNDPRAGKIAETYFRRHQTKLNTVIPKGQAFRLSFAGSHCKGSIFRNGNHYISEALIQKFDEITADISGFYYGRFDVRFENIEKLIQGKNFSILEINGAGSEATHIWDRNTKLSDVYKTLFHQYRTLFSIGDINRKQGYKPPAIRQLLTAWREESRLVKQYPETD